MDSIDIRLIGLAVLAAAGYGIATIGMKVASDHWSFVAALLIAIGFIAATQTEILLMRHVTLGALYLLIIAVETLIVLTYAYSIGEGLTTRDLGGGALILVGLAIVSH